MPAFTRRFHCIAVEDGLPMIAEEGARGVCRFVARDVVGAAILRYVTDEVSREEYAWTAKQARDAADFWHSYTDARPRPAPLLWADEEGLCFHRLPWVKVEAPAELPPAWADTLGRMSNAPAFAAWVGSLFDPKADLQQYVWLYGQGDNGKGTIMRFLEKALGPSFASQQPPSRDDKFWTFGLRDKRLVVFADCNNVSFVASGLFKSLTGGDAIRIEGKGKDAQTARLSCKFLFASNERPSLSSERADMRRAIFCEMSAIVGPADSSFEERLWSEGGAFLAYCIAAYQAACPAGGRIGGVELDELTEWVSAVEERLDVAFHSSFMKHPVHEGVNLRDIPYVRPEEFQAVIAHFFGRDLRSEKEFRNYCERAHGIKKHKVKMPDKTLDNRYVGITMRPNWRSEA